MKLKLFLVTQDENTGYDTYDGFVVCAESTEEARMCRPLDDDPIASTWASDYDNVKVEYLGEATERLERGIILDSFNAG